MVSVPGNFIIINFYWHEHRKIVPMLYICLAITDCIIMSKALTDVLLFAVVASTPEYATIGVQFGGFIGGVTFASFILFQTVTRIYPFFNAILATVRAIHLVSPFYHIKTRLVLASYITYIMFWLIVFLIIFVIKPVGIDGNDFNITQSSVHCDEFNYCDFGGSDKSHYPWLQVVPYWTPCAVVIVALFITLYTIQRSHMAQRDSWNITITIIILTVAFLVCNLSYTTFKHIVLNEKAKHYLFWCYFSTNTLIYCNATLNPIILIYQGKKIRQSLLQKVNSCLTQRVTPVTVQHTNRKIMVHVNSAACDDVVDFR